MGKSQSKEKIKVSLTDKGNALNCKSIKISYNEVVEVDPDDELIIQLITKKVIQIEN